MPAEILDARPESATPLPSTTVPRFIASSVYWVALPLWSAYVSRRQVMLDPISAMRSARSG